MQDLRSLISSPSSLFTFEAAARHLSFTRAAEELKVSQPAVSHSIRQLERYLGVPLFERRHRALELTEEGRKLFRDVSIGLTHIYHSAQTLRHSRGASNQVTISISTAFATYWLLPRMAIFRQAHPDIDLRFQTTDRDLDLSAEGIGIGIRLGTGNWPHYDAWHFVDEKVFPVCRPDYLTQCVPLQTPADLLEATLIHLEEPHRSRITWNDWFRYFGIEAETTTRGLKLNDYSIVIQAALEGQGIALGWKHIVDKLLERGDLVRPIDATYVSQNSFYVVAPKSIPLTEPTAVLRDWLVAEKDKTSASI